MSKMRTLVDTALQRILQQSAEMSMNDWHVLIKRVPLNCLDFKKERQKRIIMNELYSIPAMTASGFSPLRTKNRFM